MEFDPYSIMIYDSNSNTKASNKYVIWQKSGDAVLMGGHHDPAKASIFAGGIARVAQMYPSGIVAGDIAKDENVSGGNKAVRVKVRDVFETTADAPNSTDLF